MTARHRKKQCVVPAGRIGWPVPEPVKVIIGGGTYYLDAPVALRPEDSGTAECPICWRAAEGKKALLSGGVRITGNWKRGADGVWSVAVPDVKEG